MDDEQDALMCALRDRRLALGLGRREVAHRSGNPTYSLAKWERGVVFPRPESLTRWAALLDVQVPEKYTTPRAIQGCPSTAAYQRHARRGEDARPCGCARAWADYIRDRYRKKACT